MSDAGSLLVDELRQFLSGNSVSFFDTFAGIEVETAKYAARRIVHGDFSHCFFAGCFQDEHFRIDISVFTHHAHVEARLHESGVEHQGVFGTGVVTYFGIAVLVEERLKAGLKTVLTVVFPGFGPVIAFTRLFLVVFRYFLLDVIRFIVELADFQLVIGKFNIHLFFIFQGRQISVYQFDFLRYRRKPDSSQQDNCRYSGDDLHNRVDFAQNYEKRKGKSYVFIPDFPRASPFFVNFKIMLKTILHEYLETSCATVVTAFEQLPHPARRQHAIHQLRVGSKKIRALLAVAKEMPGYHLKTRSYLSTLRLLQDIGGISRDTRLQEQFLTHHEKTIGWRFSVAHLLLKTRSATADNALTATMERLSIKKLSRLSDAFKEAIADIDETAAIDAIIAHVATMYNETKLPESNAPASSWHDLRKRMKRLYYQLGIVTQLPHHTRQHQEQLQHSKKAGELLGQWHDASELLVFIKNTATHIRKEKIMLPEEVPQLIKLLQRETKEKLAESAKHLRDLGIF